MKYFEPVGHVHVCVSLFVNTTAAVFPLLSYVICPLILLASPSTPGEEHSLLKVCLPLTPRSATHVWDVKGADWSQLLCLKRGMRSLHYGLQWWIQKQRVCEGLGLAGQLHVGTCRLDARLKHGNVRRSNLRLEDVRSQV